MGAFQPLEILKVAFIGSVDDGKSTLIGRIFHDKDVLFEDQKQEIVRSSQKRGTELNLALFTDGLKSEREQGITIDIAYRFFSSDQRRYIVIDCPGHAQYLRNMVTGCSQAHVAVVLLDVQNGITEQTRRHIALTSLLRVPHVIFAVNKMDLMDNSEEAFQKIKGELDGVLQHYAYSEKDLIPISATQGDNVIENLGKIPWYRGPSLFEAVDRSEGSNHQSTAHAPFRFQVQRTNFLHHPALGEFRGYAGKILQGSVSVGDTITVGANLLPAKIEGIHTLDDPKLTQAREGQSVTLTLDSDLDCSRGDYIFSGDSMSCENEADALIFNLSAKNIQKGESLVMKHGSEYLKVKLSEIESSTDIAHPIPSSGMKRGLDSVHQNEIGNVKIRIHKKILFDSFDRVKSSGSFVLIHPATNETVAVGLFTVSGQRKI